MTALRARMHAGSQLLGVILRMPSEALVELAGLAGLDFVILDCEHGPVEGLQHHLTAAAAAGLPAVVRVSGESRAEIQRALDLGAEGIVVPHTDGAAAARDAVRAAHYPPAGDRGFATYTRAGRYGLVPAAEHLARANSQTAVIVMVEDRAGTDAAAQIAATEGVDALFAGPADLAADLGYPGETGHPLVTGAITRINAAARQHGRAVMTIVSDVAGGRAAYAAGATMVAWNAQAAITGLFTRLADARPPESLTGKGSPP